MENETKKINVVSCTMLQDKGNFKTYAVIADDGVRYGATEVFEAGEHTVTVTMNGNYRNIKSQAAVAASAASGAKKPFAARDYKFEKRKAALDASIVLFSKRENYKSEDVLKIADSFYNWLNQ